MTCNRRTLSELLAKILVLSAIAPTAWGLSCQQKASDSSFVAIGHGPFLEGFGAGSVRIGNSGSPDLSVDTVTYQITRVVGPGTDDEFDAEGFLVNWKAYVQNGVLSREACITVGKPGLFDGGVPPGVGVILAVYVNGHESNTDSGIVNLLPECGNLFGCFGSVPLNTEEGGLKILTKYLKFPHRASPGSQPTAAINNIVIVMQPGTPLDHELGGWRIGNLTFNAMAPIVLVHGWKAGPWWWGDSPSTATPCGIDTNRKSGKGTRDGGFGFIDPLVSGHYPFDCSIEVDQFALDEAGAASLQQKLLTCGNASGLPDVNFTCPDGSRATGKLAEFGAKHAHLVVHSKGGLWARQMLDHLRSQTDTNGNQLLGIYSLTTLETPHLGSSLADLLVAGHTVPLFQLLGIVSIDPRIIATFFQGRAGADDMQVGIATDNSNKWGIAPGTFTVDGVQNNAAYYAIGSNADVSRNGKIDGATNPGDANTPPDEGYPPPPGVGPFATIVQNQRFQWLGEIKKGNIHRFRLFGRTIISIADFDPTPSFQSNDLAVTVASALGAPGFQQPTQSQVCNSVPLPCRLANHSTAGSSSSWNPAAQQVLSFIRQAQPIQ